MDKQSIEQAIAAFTMKDIKAFSKKDLDKLLIIMERIAAGDPGPLLREMLNNTIAEGL